VGDINTRLETEIPVSLSQNTVCESLAYLAKYHIAPLSKQSLVETAEGEELPMREQARTYGRCNWKRHGSY